MLNEAYSRVEYRLDREGFDSIPALIRYYVGNRKPVSQVGLVTIFLLIKVSLKFILYCYYSGWWVSSL